MSLWEAVESLPLRNEGGLCDSGFYQNFLVCPGRPALTSSSSSCSLASWSWADAGCSKSSYSGVQRGHKAMGRDTLTLSCPGLPFQVSQMSRGLSPFYCPSNIWRCQIPKTSEGTRYPASQLHLPQTELSHGYLPPGRLGFLK